MANMTFKANLLPNTDLGYSLGSENQRWNIYGKFAHTPNNTTTFLRGDNTFSNTLTGNIYTKGYYLNQADANSTQANHAAIYIWGDNATFTYRDSSNAYLGDAFKYNITNGNVSFNHEVTIPTGSLRIGTEGSTSAQRLMSVASGAGALALYADASTTGSRGLWANAHGTGAGKSVIVIDTNNNATFAGNADTATKWKTARTLTIGSTGKSVDGSANVSWSHAEIGATVSNAWTAGTTAGPTIKTTVNGVTGTAVAIPSASASASGVVTTGGQTFAGTKTFSNNPFITTNSNPTLVIKNTDMDTHAASLSAAEYGSLYFYDKNSENSLAGYIQTSQATNGNVALIIASRRRNAANDANISNAITLTTARDGTLSVSVSSPAAWRSALGLDGVYVKKAGDTMTGPLTMNMAAQQLIVPYNGTNYDVLHNHNNGNYSLSACSGGLYMGYYNTTLMDWLKGKMTLSATGNLTLNNGLLQITNNSNTLSLGSTNSNYCHITNSAAIPFWFNQSIQIATGKTIGAAGTAYRPYQLYLGRSGTSDSKALNSANPLIEFANTDRSQYGQIIYTDFNNQGGSDSFSFRSNQTDLRVYAPKVHGAVWNDYAEFRQSEITEPGRCIKELGNGELVLSEKRLEKGCEIISDTYGFAIGESDKCKTPTAAVGRVLAIPYEDKAIFKQHIGDPVCSGPNGTVSIMTEEEEMRYPSRIIGTISEIPDYEIWEAGDDGRLKIKVNGRIWIRIR